MKRFRDGEFRTQREEPKNPKSKNLFWARNLSPKKLGLDTLKIVSRREKTQTRTFFAKTF